MQRHSPLFIMVENHEWITSYPLAPFYFFLFHSGDVLEEVMSSFLYTYMTAIRVSGIVTSNPTISARTPRRLIKPSKSPRRNKFHFEPLVISPLLLSASRTPSFWSMIRYLYCPYLRAHITPGTIRRRNPRKTITP